MSCRGNYYDNTAIESFWATLKTECSGALTAETRPQTQSMVFDYIEGRLSRFLKIGGEMVPHETVEAALLKTMDLEGESAWQIAMVGVLDLDKGEALVQLCVEHENPPELIALRHKLLDQGVPALWILKKIARVPEIPMLASGKLDMKGYETAALKA